MTLPGSKSMTNRALMLAALADGPERRTRALRSRDTELMAAALRALGAMLTSDERSSVDWQVAPGPLRGGPRDRRAGWPAPSCGSCRRSPRWPTARSFFDGDPHARNRPMGPLLGALRALGARGSTATPCRSPCTAAAARRAARSRIDASGVLAVRLRPAAGRAALRQGRRRAARGPAGALLPHIEMTVADAARARASRSTTPSADVWRVAARPDRAPATSTVEPDLSNAAPFLAAALVTGGRSPIPGWPARPPSPATRCATCSPRWAPTVRPRRPTGLTVTGTGPIRGIDADLHDVGELTPTIAALAALADSPSTLRGIAHMRGHETDRLAALATEINRARRRRTRDRDGLRSGRARCTAGSSTPTTTTGWRPPAR